MATTENTKIFRIHNITIEDESGRVFTMDLDKCKITPADTADCNSINNLWLRLGLLIGAGTVALNEYGITLK